MHFWLVVSNMNFIFHSIWNNPSRWLICFHLSRSARESLVNCSMPICESLGARCASAQVKEHFQFTRDAPKREVRTCPLFPFGMVWVQWFQYVSMVSTVSYHEHYMPGSKHSLWMLVYVGLWSSIMGVQNRTVPIIGSQVPTNEVVPIWPSPRKNMGHMHWSWRWKTQRLG